MVVLDGKKTSNDIKNEIAEEVKSIKNNGYRAPHLAAIIVGNDGASLTYVGSKVRACERIGFESTLISLEDSISEAELLLHHPSSQHQLDVHARSICQHRTACGKNDQKCEDYVRLLVSSHPAPNSFAD